MARLSRLLPLLTAGWALAAVLFAGCGGGGDDSAKVEAGLRSYLSTLVPEESGLPTGAGPPQVAGHSCRDRHVKNGDSVGLALFDPHVPRTGHLQLSVWSCVVRVGNIALPVSVVVNDKTQVVWASGSQTRARSAPRVYSNRGGRRMRARPPARKT